MKGVLPWLACWARRSGTRDFSRALAALISPVQNNIFLTARFFHFISPHPPETWEGSRAGSPVSVSLDKTEGEHLRGAQHREIIHTEE
jgi:hypothetical protein